MRMRLILPSFILAVASSLVHAGEQVDLDQHLNEALKNGSAKHLLSDSWPGLAAAKQALGRAGLKPDGAWRVESSKNDDIGQTGCSFVATSFLINTPTPKNPNLIWVYETRAPHCPK